MMSLRARTDENLIQQDQVMVSKHSCWNVSTVWEAMWRQYGGRQCHVKHYNYNYNSCPQHLLKSPASAYHTVFHLNVQFIVTPLS